MNYSTSYGIIPIKKNRAQWRFLMVLHQSGFWAFPKGHPEPEETHEQTAIRELKEETNLSVVKFFSDKTFKESYIYHFNKELINKTVYYYIAEVRGRSKPQQEEICECRWVSAEEALKLITYPEMKSLFLEVLSTMKIKIAP